MTNDNQYFTVFQGSVEGTPLVESVPRMCSFCDDEFGKIHTQECRNFKQFFVKEIFENNISCMFCSKSYKKLDGLYDHLENKHGKEIKQVLKKKEILCKHCQGPKYSKFSKSCKKCLDDILKKNFESFEGYKFKCLKCNKQLDNKTYTYDHFETCSKTTEIENLFSGDEDEDISNSKSALYVTYIMKVIPILFAVLFDKDCEKPQRQLSFWNKPEGTI